MTEECLHHKLDVRWGDDAAYWEKALDLVLEDGIHRVDKEYDWQIKDGTNPMDSDSVWLVSAQCVDCGYWLVEDAISRPRNTYEQDIINNVRATGCE